MTRVLVVEGNTPELVEAAVAVRCRPAAEHYAEVLSTLAAARGVALETTILRPYFPEGDIEALDLNGFDGVAFTGSGVDWSADDARAAPFLRLLERIFTAGLPVIGSCWGLQVGAVVLGGCVGQGARGLELGVARHVRLTPAGSAHPFHAGRAPAFDVPCIHRDEVTLVPAGAVVTAENDHSAVQAMVFETGGVRFWGMQYHPELGPEDTLGYMLCRDDAGIAKLGLFRDRADLVAMIDDMRRIMADPDREAGLAWRYGLRGDVLDGSQRRAELDNWLGAIGLPARMSEPAGAALLR